MVIKDLLEELRKRYTNTNQGQTHSETCYLWHPICAILMLIEMAIMLTRKKNLMGYWNSSAEGGSLLAEDTGLIWGDSPADYFDIMIRQLKDLYPNDLTLEKVVQWFEEVFATDAIDNISPHYPIIKSAIANARECFEEDIERYPTHTELLAGLKFSYFDDEDE